MKALLNTSFCPFYIYLGAYFEIVSLQVNQYVFKLV